MTLKQINVGFFKYWTPEMSYILGYITADGCIVRDDHRRKNPYTINVTSREKSHLYRIRKGIDSTHKISKKQSTYQLQIRNLALAKDLMALGVMPRKTYLLRAMNVPNEYFSDFARGFFDGDGTVYLYRVNGVLQIKARFVSTSIQFLDKFSGQLCLNLGVPTKTIHRRDEHTRNMKLYGVDFYIGDCEKLASYIYHGNCSLYLPRKRRIFEKWKKRKRRQYKKDEYP